MTRLAPWLLSLALLASLSACKKTETETTAPDGHAEHKEGHHDESQFEGRDVVGNWEAQPGDVTLCPMSGEKFEVKADSPTYAYQGHDFKFCCPMCLEKTQADPGKYLDVLVEQAGGPIGDATAEAPPAEETPAGE